MIFFVFIIVDNTRLIGRLGTNFPVPVEGISCCSGSKQEIRKLGATEIMLRLAKGKDGPVVTENIIWFWMFLFRDIGSAIGKRSPVSWRVGGYRPEVVVTG